MSDDLSLWKQWREDYETHGRDLTLPGFRALAFHRFGMWRLRVRPRQLRAPFTFLYRRLFRRARDRYGIEIPHSVVVGRRVRIEHQCGIVVHGSAVIGDDVSIGSNAVVLDDVSAGSTVVGPRVAIRQPEELP